MSATIGLFGGTFDPAHIGHAQMARAALAAGLSRVVVMPCWLSPHKTDFSANEAPAAGADRQRMLELALSELAGVEISAYELEKGGVSFTWQTLEFLRKKFGNAHVALIVGSDQYAAFPRWERFAEWSRGLDIYVFKRAGAAVADAADTALINSEAVWHWLDAEIADVSAREIRRRARAGEPLAGLVNERVEEYIRAHGLYRFLQGDHGEHGVYSN